MAASTTTTSAPTPSASSHGSSNRYCFDVAQFAEEAFDPATFVTAAKEVASLEVRTSHPVPHRRMLLASMTWPNPTHRSTHPHPQVLRDHLRGYQRDLREELYEVINRDLADYLKLSSKASQQPG